MTLNATQIFNSHMAECFNELERAKSFEDLIAIIEGSYRVNCMRYAEINEFDVIDKCYDIVLPIVYHLDNVKEDKYSDILKEFEKEPDDDINRICIKANRKYLDCVQASKEHHKSAEDFMKLLTHLLSILCNNQVKATMMGKKDKAIIIGECIAIIKSGINALLWKCSNKR